jgi:hypothetical protein
MWRGKRGEIVWGVVVDRREGRAKIGGKDTRCSGSETERGERKTKEGRRRRDARRRCGVRGG